MKTTVVYLIFKIFLMTFFMLYNCQQFTPRQEEEAAAEEKRFIDMKLT